MGFFFDNDSITPTKPSSGGGGSAVIEELNVTPTTSAQVITAPSGTDGYNPVNVSAVTSSIDANIVASNIVDGITILGVTGSATELNGTTLNVTPTTSAQTITPTSPNNGFTEVDVDAVTSSIDANIQAGNIKNGVTILGVTGNVNALVGQTKSVSQNGVVTPDAGYNGLTSVSVNVPSSLVKANYWVYDNGTVENIRTYDSSVKLAADATTINNQDLRNVYSGLDPAKITKVSFGSVTTISADYALALGFANDVYLTDIDFPSLTTISGSNVMAYMFQGCTALEKINMPKLTTIYGEVACGVLCGSKHLMTEASFPSLTTISGDFACSQMFINCDYITKADLSSLTTISGVECCGEMFSSCTSLTDVNISSLSTVNNTGCFEMFYGCTSLVDVNLTSLQNMTNNRCLMSMFKGCTSLENVYFNSLTTTSFATSPRAMQSFLLDTGTNVTHTLHFPSNLQSTISALSDYPLFGGTSGYVTLAFDLPATS